MPGGVPLIAVVSSVAVTMAVSHVLFVWWQSHYCYVPLCSPVHLVQSQSSSLFHQCVCHFLRNPICRCMSLLYALFVTSCHLLLNTTIAWHTIACALCCYLIWLSHFTAAISLPSTCLAPEPLHACSCCLSVNPHVFRSKMANIQMTR